VKKRKRRIVNNEGFSLIELIVIMTILSILISIAVPLYKGYVERATQQVCNANCLQLERMYHVYLLMENKEHTAYIFDEFLQKYEQNICPTNGGIKYVNGKVRCTLHFEDEANGNDDGEGDGSVPFL
jgi:prepilin-type N-terminal cleavage/methylation domain-containing protein